MERYDVIEKKNPLGTGTYGVVYKAKDKVSGKVVALKRVCIDKEDEGIPTTVLREISLLRQLRHPNIVELNDVVQNDGQLFLVFELVECDLKKYLDSNDNVAPEIVKSFVHQLLEGIDFCHVRGIIHRDLKPQNLLVSSSSLRLKIADFGLSRCFVPPVRPLTHEVVTLWYRSPELLLGSRIYSLPVDLWSIGTILAELSNGRPMFAGGSEIEQIHRIFKVLGTPNENEWPGVTQLQDWCCEFPQWPPMNLDRVVNRREEREGHKLSEDGLDLLQRLLEMDPKQRITARGALEHSYFDNI